MTITLAYLGIFFGGLGLMFIGMALLWWVSLHKSTATP